MSGEVWATVYDRLAQLIEEHHTTLIFANTRRMVERVSRQLAERLGETAVAAHHGSLSQRNPLRCRAAAESRLTQGHGGHRVAGARHRHRRRRAGLPAGYAALDLRIPAARRPRQPLGEWRAEGAHLPGAAATSWWIAWRCSTPCGAASSTGCASPNTRSTCSRSRSWPKWRHANTAKMNCSTWCAARIRIATSSAGTSTPWCACWPKASAPSAAGAAPTCIAMPSTRCCGRARARASRPSPAAAPFRTTPTTRSSSSRPASSWARSTRTSPSKASPATSSSSATRHIASCAWKPAACASKMPRASRRPFPSGSARRRRAPTSSPRPCRACAPTSKRCCPR